MVVSGVSCSSALLFKYGALVIIRVANLKKSSAGSGWTDFIDVSSYVKPTALYQGVLANDTTSVDGGYVVGECRVTTGGMFQIYAPIKNVYYWGSLVVINK